MKANELRIGNYFKWISTQDVDTVEEIVTYNKSTCDINSVSISDCEPIPLTEEWLERFGFKILRSFNGTDADINNFNLWKFKDSDYWEYSTVNDRYNSCNEVNVSVRYLHQLQNLYFALTGEELNVSE